MDVMTGSELAEVLHELAGLVERPKAESGHTAERFQGWLEAHGFVQGHELGQWVRPEGDVVDIEIKGLSMAHGVMTAEGGVPDDRVAIRVFVSMAHMDRQAIGLTEMAPSLTGLIDAMNGGELKREIDEAVDWDPELAI